MTIGLLSQTPQKAKVQIIGAFSNVRISDDTGESHAYGFQLELYQEGSQVFGLFYSSQGLAGDTPRGRIQGVRYNEQSGALSFRARLTTGMEYSRESGPQGRPSRDLFEFEGYIQKGVVKGKLTTKNGYHPSDQGRKQSITLKPDRESTKYMLEYPPESYASWLNQKVPFGPNW